MATVKVIKNYDGYKKGDIITIPNNDAHTMIDKEVAKLYQPRTYSNKMMTTKEN